MGRTIYTPRLFKEQTTPSTPATGFVGIYAKSDGMYEILDDGTERQLYNTGSSATTWSGTTANATQTEIFVGGVASSRLTISASSSMVFSILVVGYDSTANNSAGYEIKGVIKRDGLNNTVLVGDLQSNILIEEDTSWSATVEADDTNEALVVKVTGDATNSVSWRATIAEASTV